MRIVDKTLRKFYNFLDLQGFLMKMNKQDVIRRTSGSRIRKLLKFFFTFQSHGRLIKAKKMNCLKRLRKKLPL